MGWFAFVALWLLTGAWFVHRSASRGRGADILFLFLWPLHILLDLMGLDR